MAYTPYHADWKDYPDTTTPITAAALEYIEAGVVATGGAAWSLASSTSVGATTLTMDQTPPSSFPSRSATIAIGIGSVTCEIRRVTAVSGKTLTLSSALANAHTAGDAILWLVDGEIAPACFGAVGNVVGGTEVDDTAALQAAINETCSGQVWLNGNYARHIILETLVLPQSSRLKNFEKFKAGVGCTFTGADDWMMMTCQDTPQTFTVDTATNTFTSPAAHGIGGSPNPIVFKGTDLPAPLVSGRIYYVKTIPTTTTFTVSSTSGGATLDITDSGSGTMMFYPDTNTMNKVYLDDVYLDGAALAQNGIVLEMQQPGYARKLRVGGCLGTGVKITGQQYVFENLEITSCDIGLHIGTSSTGATMMYFFGVNVEQCAVGIRAENVQHCGIWGLHCEANTSYHIHFPATADIRNFTVDTAILPVGVGTAAILCETTLAAYTLKGVAPYGGATSDTFISDTGRGYTLTKGDIGDATQHNDSSLFQPYGSEAPSGQTTRILSKSADYTAKMMDDLILVNATGAARTVTLPAAVNTGKRITVKKTDSSGNAVTVDGNSTELIDGAATKVLAAQYDTTTLVSDGTGWQVV